MYGNPPVLCYNGVSRMPSVTLDLPAEVLDAVNRLAQKLNVSRAEVLVRAVGVWAGADDLAAALAAERDRAGELERRVASLRGQEAAARTAARRAGAALDPLRDQLGVALQARRRAETEVRLARERAERAGHAADAAKREAQAAEARARAAEEREMAKSAAAVRDAEVARLRDHARELAVRMQTLEADLAHRVMQAGQAGKKAAAAAARATAAERKIPPLIRKLTQAEKAGFAAERQIGGLLRDRAKLREALKKLAREIAQAGAPPAAKPRRSVG